MPQELPRPSDYEKVLEYDDFAQSDEYRRLSPLSDKDLIPRKFLIKLYEAIHTDQYSQTDMIEPHPSRPSHLHKYKITGTLTAERIAEMWSEELADDLGLTDIEKERCLLAIRTSEGSVRQRYEGDITELLSGYMSAKYFDENEFNQCMSGEKTPPAIFNKTPLSNEEIQNRLKPVSKILTLIVKSRLSREIRAINEDRKSKRVAGMEESASHLHSRRPSRKPSL